MENEVWKTYPQCSRYEVSNYGNIKCEGRVLPQYVDRLGYHKVNLYINKKVKVERIHRMVAKAFIPNPLKRKEINHKNGIKTDNRSENLEWCTRSENMLHAFKTGLQIPLKAETHPCSKINWKIVNAIRDDYNNSGVTQLELESRYGVKRGRIASILNNKSWKDSTYTQHRVRDFATSKRILTWDQVNSIRQQYNSSLHKSLSSIATQHNMSHGCIYDIITNRNWHDHSYVRTRFGRRK